MEHGHEAAEGNGRDILCPGKPPRVVRHAVEYGPNLLHGAKYIIIFAVCAGGSRSRATAAIFRTECKGVWGTDGRIKIFSLFTLDGEG